MGRCNQYNTGKSLGSVGVVLGGIPLRHSSCTNDPMEMMATHPAADGGPFASLKDATILFHPTSGDNHSRFLLFLVNIERIESDYHHWWDGKVWSH